MSKSHVCLGCERSCPVIGKDPVTRRDKEICCGVDAQGNPVDLALRVKYFKLWKSLGLANDFDLSSLYQEPSLARKAVNFSAAIARRVRDGRNVTGEEKHERLKICEGCEHYIREKMACSHYKCGCNLKTKAGWASEDCPKGNWPQIGEAPNDSEKENTQILNEQKEITSRINASSQWAVGVTTAPRGQYTLSSTINSLQKSGWDPVVFAEPKSKLSGFDAPIVQRRDPLGCWHNWFQMAHSLLDNTDAEWIMTVQDDIEIVAGSREITEQYLTKNPQVAFLSLYTAKHYQMRYDVVDEKGKRLCSFPNATAANQHARKKGHRVQIFEWPKPSINRIVTGSFWGACALAFPRASLRKILDHRIARSWNGSGGRHSRPQTKNSDTAIGRICNSLKLPMMTVNPSLASHIAKVSSISHGDNTGRRNCLYYAKDEKQPVEQLFAECLS